MKKESRLYLRLVVAPGGLVHVQDVRRGNRTLCGRGVFFHDGWQPRAVSYGTRCQVCARISRRRYDTRA